MYNRNFYHRLPHGRLVRFNPVGDMYGYTLRKARGVRLNPQLSRQTTELPGWGRCWTVRMFVGFNVHFRPMFKLADLVGETRNFLSKLRWTNDKGISKPFPQDSSFIAQRGVYTHGETGDVVEEDSGQVIIMDTVLFDKAIFLKAMQSLAEHLVVVFNQREVIVQVLYGDVVRDTWSVVQ